MAMEGNRKPEGVPPVTEDIGLPTPPSPGRLPPPHLPPPTSDQGETSERRDEAAPSEGSEA